MDNAGGRFAIEGNQIKVANGSLLDFETANSHNITVRVTDAAGFSLEQIFSIRVTDDVSDTPANFDENFYLVMNYDAANAVLTGTVNSPLAHYLQVGQPEGRAGAPTQPSTFNIEFDYRFDTNGFFNDPNRKATLELAADVWESVIQDEFTNISTGTEFWVKNPQTGQQDRVILDKEIEDLVIFVGSQSLKNDADGTVFGQTNDYAVGSSTDANSFSYVFPDRFNGVNYEPYAGSISFNSSIPWYADGTPYDLTDNVFDGSVTTGGIFGTTIHEIGHALGIGLSPAFTARINGTSFDGPNAKAVNGGNTIPLSIDESHVQDNFVTNDGVSALLGHAAYLPTKVDLALLADMGYKFQGFTAQDSTPTPATEGDNQILGTDLADNISGLGGNDTIVGVSGNDILNGEAGNDYLTGGGGSDTFAFGAANGQDTIFDFAIADDKIQLAASLGFSSNAAVLAAFGNPDNSTDGNGNVIGLFSNITFSAGNTLTVVHDAPLTEANFTIV